MRCEHQSNQGESMMATPRASRSKVLEIAFHWNFVPAISIRSRCRRGLRMPKTRNAKSDQRDSQYLIPGLQSDEESMPGRGGALHKLWQDELKSKAEALNFLATIECEVPSGSVDVLLKRGDINIACEILVTSPIASEVNHIEGRLKAGISRVAVVSESSQRLRHIPGAAIAQIPH
jgi:hypothetical protein